MKKIISVLITTAILLSIVILEQIFVDNTLNTLISKINLLDNTITISENINTQELKTIIFDIDDYWTNKEKVMCLTINHNDLNRVGEQIKKIKVYIEQNDKDDCVYEVKTLAFYAESYKHVMEVNVQNLL